MEICELYEIVKKWETALTLTKPKEVTSIRVSPIIEDDIQSAGEGDIHSYFKIHIEIKGKYTELIYGYDVTHYKDDTERKWVEESQVFLLTEYIEDWMDIDCINSFWEDFPWDITWKPLL